MNLAVSLKLNLATKAWESDLHTEALRILSNELIKDPLIIDFWILKIKWLMCQHDFKEAYKTSKDFWLKTKNPIAIETLSITSEIIYNNLESLENKSCSDEVISILSKAYSQKVLLENDEYKSSPQNNPTKIIWQCWLQGIDNAPKSVKECIQSVKKYNAEFQHIFITLDNYRDFINLPEYIIKKHKNGIIPHAHFSDILRTFILSQHGGIWIDPTVLQLGRLPSEILTTPFFVFKKDDGIGMSNWFISSGIGHPLIEMIKDLLLLYWQKNDELIHYFIWHWFFCTSHQESSFLSQLFKKIPFSNTLNCHYLQEALRLNLSNEEVLRFKHQFFLHKLTYKDEHLIAKYPELLKH